MAGKQAGTLWVPAKIDFKTFRAQVKQDLPREAKAGGEITASELAKGLKTTLDQKMGTLREGLAKGLFDKAAFKKEMDAAKREYNKGVLALLKDLEKAGQRNTEEYTKLAKSLKQVGTAGRQGGQEAAQAVGLLGRATAGLKTMALGAVSAFAGLFALGRLKSLADDTLRVAREAELSASRQAAVWERNAGHVGRTFDEIKRFSLGMQRTTLFKADEVDLAISQLLTYKSIAGDAFERTIKLGADMASVFGGIEQSTMALARALDDPIRGLGQLRKMGYTFEDSVVSQVKALTEQNRLFEAQRLLLSELEKEVSGTAAAMKSGWVGMMDDAAKTWEKIKIRVGQAIAVPVATTVVGWADAFHKLVDPLGAATDGLERFGVAAEHVLETRLTMRLAELRDEIKQLENEAASATIVTGATSGVGQHGGAAFGPRVVQIGKLAPAALGRMRDELDKKREEQQRRLNQAIADRNVTEQRAAQRVLDDTMKQLQAIDGVRAAREKLAATNAELAKTEDKLADAKAKSDLRSQVEDIDRQIRAIERAGSWSVATLKVLDQLRAKRAEIEQKLAGSSTTQTGGAALTEDQIKAAESALKSLTASMQEFQTAAALGVSDLRAAPGQVQDAVRELVAAQEQVKKAEEAIQAIRAGGKAVPPGAEAYLAQLKATRDQLRGLAQEEIKVFQKALPEITVALQKTMGRLPETMLTMEGHARSIGQVFRETANHARLVADAERELTHAQMARDPERIVRAEKALTAARKAMAENTAQIARSLKNANLPANELNRILERLQKLLEDAGVKAEVLPSNLQKASGVIGQIASAARGVMSVADAMGALDDRTRSALQATVDLADGLAKVVSSKGADIGGIVQTIGAAVKLFSGAADKAERLRLVESQADLIRALDRLRDAVMQDTTRAEKERLLASGGDIVARIVQAAKDPFTFAKKTKEIASDPAVIAAIKDIEEKSGMGGRIYKDGKIDVAALNEAMKIIENMDLAGFDKTLQGRLDALNFALRALGDEAGTAEEQLARFLGVVRKWSPNFAAELERVMAADGSEAALEWVRSLAEAFGAEGLESSVIRQLFGDDVTPRDVQRIIEEALGFVSGERGGGGIVGSADTRLSVSMTAMQGNELLRLQSTQTYHQAEIHRLLAAMVGAPAPAYAMALPTITPPSPESLGLTDRMQGVMADLRGMQVNVNIQGVVDKLTPDAAADIGHVTGGAIGDASIERLQAAYRGSGATGPARVQVNVRME